ncbi:MAG: PaaI family thioesterase [Anaerostipes sp.]|nr:PaaI family thioesterase [Anaerostipes sp.]
MNKKTFEEHLKSRMEVINSVPEHSIFRELRGEIISSSYEEKNIVMEFEATEFHRNGFDILFGGSLVGMFDITFGTLTVGLGDYSIAPTVQLSTTFLKGIPIGSKIQIQAQAVSTGKTIMNFVGKAFVGDELVGSASGIFKTPRKLDES